MKDVYANGHEIASEAGGGKVVAAFPDVCMSPPPPPAGPVPVPYPNSSFSKDMKNGSKSVMIGGKAVMLRDKSHYATSPLGDEAATRNFGAGLITHTITGKTHFVAWSIDVQFEGKNVPRHIDLTTSNHGSNANNPAPIPNISMSTTGSTVDASVKLCPCCKGPLHENQKDSTTREAYESIPEMGFYESIAKHYMRRRDEMQDILNRVAAGTAAMPPWATKLATTDNNPAYQSMPLKDVIVAKGTAFERDFARLKELRAKNPDCPNVHTPPDQECGVHFKVKGTGQGTAARVHFKDSVRNRSISEWKQKGFNVRNSSPVAHKTPLDAGGCPLSMKNLVPEDVLTGECAEIEAVQTRLQNSIPNDKKERAKLFQ